MALLEYMSETNVEDFSDVEHLILSDESAAAQTINDEIEVLNYMEDACQMYFNLHLSQSELSLSSEDSTQLYELATLCADSVGPCVYKAKALYAVLFNGRYLHSNCETIDGARVRSSNDKNVLGRKSLSDIKLYPNPGTGVFDISGLSDGNHVLRILDLSGREVCRMNVIAENGSGSISLEADNGLYLLSIDSEPGFSHKLIIQR